MKAVYENHYLTDRDVANFARQSFAKLADHFTEEQNHNLIKFLARGMSSGDWEKLIVQMIQLGNNSVELALDEAKDLAVYLRKIPEHWVPFGHPHISIRMQAPVPIARQAFKHKIGFVESEESRRYISSEPEFYYPEFFRKAAANVKQGSSQDPLETMSELRYIPVYSDNKSKPGFMRTNNPMEIYKAHCETSKRLYLDALESGMCPEQARFFLPQGTEVNWVWTGSLYAFANFYNQRSDSHAQQEIQELAKEVDKIIAPLYPISWAALTKGVF